MCACARATARLPGGWLATGGSQQQAVVPILFRSLTQSGLLAAWASQHQGTRKEMLNFTLSLRKNQHCF